MATSKAVAKKKEQELAMAGMFEEDAGKGLETADKDSFAIPMLNILQKGSPQVDEDDGAYVDGAKAGMIYNTVEETVEDKIRVVPVAFRRSFIEWVPRDAGGGFVAEHPVEYFNELQAKGEVQVDDDYNQVLPNGNHIVDTRTHFVLRVKGDGELDWEAAMISMSSSQLKKSKRWNSQMKGLRIEGSSGLYNPPTFSQIYELSTVPEQNDKGSWRGWKIGNPQSITNPELYKAAKEFKDSLEAGAVKVDHGQANKSGETDTAEY